MKKKIIIYGIGTIFSKILVFLMVPIYTRLFSTEDYGYYDVIISDVQMLISICYVEIWSGILRFMFLNKKKEIAIKCYLKLFPYMSVLYLIILWGISKYIYIRYPIITFFYGILYLAYTVGNTICRGYEKNTDYVLSGMAYTFLSCICSIFFSVVFNLGIRGLFEAQCIGYMVSVIYVEIRTSAIKNALKVQITKDDIKDLLQYSIPLMFNSFSFLLLGTYNKNLILKYLGENESGLYAFVLKFSAVFSILISIYSLAWQEQAFSAAEGENKAKIYSYYVNKFLKIIGLAVPGFILISYIMAPIIGGGNYYVSNTYIALSVSAAYISEISGILSVIIAVGKKTLQTFLSTLMGAIVNIILVHHLILNFGVNGSSFALNIGFLVATIVRYLFIKKEIPIKLQLRYMVCYFIELIIFIIITKITKSLLLWIYCPAIGIIWLGVNYKDIKSIVLDIKNNLRREKHYEKD